MGAIYHSIGAILCSHMHLLLLLLLLLHIGLLMLAKLLLTLHCAEDASRLHQLGVCVGNALFL